ncbi:unnamed protein product [Diamesa serratosioi]
MDLDKVLDISTAVTFSNLGLIGCYLSYKNSKESFDNGMKNMKLSKKLLLPLFFGLQSGIGYGSYIVWMVGNDTTVDTKIGIPMVLYGSQLLLNWVWPAFYGRSLKWSCFESIGLTALASATAYSFYKLDKTAGLFCIPYISGLIYMTVENYLAYKTELKEKADDDAATATAPTSKKRKII